MQEAEGQSFKKLGRSALKETDCMQEAEGQSFKKLGRSAL